MHASHFKSVLDGILSADWDRSSHPPGPKPKWISISSIMGLVVLSPCFLTSEGDKDKVCTGVNICQQFSSLCFASLQLFISYNYLCQRMVNTASALAVLRLTETLGHFILRRTTWNAMKCKLFFVQYGAAMCTEATRHSLEVLRCSWQGAVPRSVPGTSEMGFRWNVFFFFKNSCSKIETNKKTQNKNKERLLVFPCPLSSAFYADRSQTPWVQSSRLFCLMSGAKGQRSHDVVEQPATWA